MQRHSNRRPHSRWHQTPYWHTFLSGVPEGEDVGQVYDDLTTLVHHCTKPAGLCGAKLVSRPCLDRPIRRNPCLER